MIRYTWVCQNHDKPHRCPECHAVRFRGRRFRLLHRIVRCDACEVYWWM